jgi:hypothetical protein
MKFVNLICHVFYLQMIQCLFKNAKHCAVNTIDFKHFPVDSISQALQILAVGRLYSLYFSDHNLT